MKARITILFALLLVVNIVNAGTITAPPTNDECSAAIELTVNDNFLCGTKTSGTISGATASPEPIAGCSTSGADDDVWFKFKATENYHKISLTDISAGDETILYHVVYDAGLAGDCTTLSVRTCNEPEVSEFSSYVKDHIYFVRVFSNDLADHTTNFNICIGSKPAVPSNDDCLSATAISLPFSNTVDASSATNNGGFINVSSCGVMNDGVWYKIVGDGSEMTIDVLPQEWDVEVAVYNGSCGSFTCVKSSNTGVSGTIEEVKFNSTNGVTYLVNIGHASDNSDESEGVFSISVTSSVLSIDKLIAKGFTYYPNPISNKLNLQAKEEIRHLEVYNAFGQKLRLFSPSKLKTDIDLSSLAAGPYFIRAYVGDAVGIFKIIKK